MSPLRLGINVDHVATIRNARGGTHPDPVRAAHTAVGAGAHGITAHLREDRRHIRDEDVARLIAELGVPLNLEMAATPEMIGIARRHRPHAVCLVPERREEVTTEGGLDVAGQQDRIRDACQELAESGSRVSLFIEADPVQLEAAVAVGAPVVELHTGSYCSARGPEQDREFARLADAAARADRLGLECHAGHGLDFETVGRIAAIATLSELNIGHFLVGEAVFTGLAEVVGRMLLLMEAARAGVPETAR